MSDQAAPNPFEQPLPSEQQSASDGAENPFAQPLPSEHTAAAPPDKSVGQHILDWGKGAVNTVSDFMKGAAAGATEHIGNTEATIAQGINKIPVVGPKIVPQEGINALRARAQQEGQTQGTAQDIGKGAESAAEFLAPGVGEEAAIGKGAGLLAKMGYGAATSGAINKAQGGGFGVGAALGAGTGAVEAGMQKLAPKLAESAVNITQKMRGNGRTIGDAILEFTHGVKPSEVSESAKSAIAALNGRLETMAANAKQTATTAPALQVLHDEYQKALEKNAAPIAQKIEQVWDQLTKEYGSGNPIPTQVPANRLLALKRGVGELVNSWEPKEKEASQVIIQKVYGALDKELDRVVPGADVINQKISSLIPAKQAAAKTANSASGAQKTVNRLRAATGALIGGAAGYHEGKEKGLLAGALAGAAGLAGPDIVSSPENVMRAARVAGSPAVAARVPVAAGSAIVRGLSKNQEK